jgi:nucleotide-binding universal stress UspA family protein
MEFNSLLVPVDLSPASEILFQRSLQMLTGENPVIILLHVLDPTLVDYISVHQFGSHNEVLQKMRHRAERELASLRNSVSTESVEIEVIISEGPPFLQIIQKAQEFLADAIVMGRVGGTRVDKLFFGSTAEKVLRASTRPVMVLPIDPPE